MDLSRRYRTQKARGCAALAAHGGGLPFGTMFSVDALKACEVWPYRHYHHFPKFGRPCPLTPRHGFVDSRVLHDVGDVMRLIAETLAIERDAEIMFGPVLEGKWSAIVNNAGVSIGRGHDGATGGKGALLIPAPVDPSMLAEAVDATQIKEAPFYEVVGHSHHAELVQMRDGPAMPATADFIPGPVRVGRVMIPHDDLLRWETEIKEASSDTVVWAHGSTLASHAAVHAIARGLAVVTSERKPVVGEMLEPTAEDNKLTKDALHYTARQLVAALKIRFGHSVLGGTSSRGAQSHCLTAVCALQASAPWGPREDLARIRAWAIATLARYLTAACAGEARHFPTAGPARYYARGLHRYKYEDRPRSKAHPDLDIAGYYDPDPVGLHGSREQYYREALALNAVECEKMAAACIRDFSGDWAGGMGGPAWLGVAVKTHDLWRAIFRFTAKPTLPRFQVMVMAANTAINTAHNGGPILTKWALVEHLTEASRVPGLGLANERIFELAFNPAAIDAAATMEA